jgi:hypothetical protein
MTAMSNVTVTVQKRRIRAALCVLGLALGGACVSLQAQTNFAVLANDGVWTWFNDPRALFNNGTLYFSYDRFSDGKTVLSTLNLQTGGVTNLWTSSLASQDDHNVAGLLPKQDGRMLAVYSRHGQDQFFCYRLSTSANPVSPSAWGAEQRNNTGTSVSSAMSYSNPFQLAAEGGKIYNFARYLNWNPNVFTSTDGGSTWSAPRIVIQTGTGGTRPYVKYCSDYNQRLDFLYTDGHPDAIPTSLYHLYYQGGAFYKTDGTLVTTYANLPILHDSGQRGSVLYQYSTAAQSDPNQWILTGRAWCWEIAYQTNGAPVCVFQVKVDNVTGSNWYDARIYYYYARWTGTTWQKRFIAQAGRPLYNGQPDYGGGMALDPQDPNTIYIATDAANPFDLSTTVNVPLGNHYELWKGVTTNGGLSFTWKAVTTNSIVDNLRPYVPRRFGGEPCVLWFEGTYATYQSFNCSIVGLFTSAVPGALAAPTITSNPTSITNAAAGATETFTVQASGPQPLVYRWFYNSNAIPAVVNPSAATASLTLTNVQLANAGYYYVTVSNGLAAGGGVATSAVAQLIVHAYSPPTTNVNLTVLQLEFVAAQNYVTPPARMQPGWQTMSLKTGPTNFTGGVKVTLSAIGGAALQDRDRVAQDNQGSTYPLVANSPPTMTTANLYNSFIYDSTTTSGTGIDILIQNLTPNTPYGVNIWSWAASSGGRVENWREALSGSTIAYQYHTSASLPVADYDDTIGALLTSDASGQLDIQGTVDPTDSGASVFLNALVITANPVPRIVSTAVATDRNLLTTAQAMYSGQTIIFQESPDLIHWQNASDGVNATTHGPIFRSEFPFSANKMFYRVVYQP